MSANATNVEIKKHKYLYATSDDRDWWCGCFLFHNVFCFLWEFMFLLINKDGLCYSGLQVHDGVVLNFVCHVQADWLSWVHTYYFSCSYTNLELWRAYRPACCLAMHAPQHIHKAIFDFMRTMCMHPMPCPTVKPHWLHEMHAFHAMSHCQATLATWNATIILLACEKVHV